METVGLRSATFGLCTVIMTVIDAWNVNVDLINVIGLNVDLM